jgi:nicotinamidase-related amidase
MHENYVPAWARSRGRTLNHFPFLEPARTALLVIDMQRAFIGTRAQSGIATDYGDLANRHAYDIIPNINRLSRTLRSAGSRVLWCRHTVATDGAGQLPTWQVTKPAFNPSLMRGAEGHGLHQDLDISPHDVVFDKYRFSCFHNAEIDVDRTLREFAVDTVIITGTLTNCCCECAARDATMRDYKVLFISDATAALTDEEQNAALLNITVAMADVVSTREALNLLEKST